MVWINWGQCKPICKTKNMLLHHSYYTVVHSKHKQNCCGVAAAKKRTDGHCCRETNRATHTQRQTILMHFIIIIKDVLWLWHFNYIFAHTSTHTIDSCNMMFSSRIFEFKHTIRMNAVRTNVIICYACSLSRIVINHFGTYRYIQPKLIRKSDCYRYYSKSHR